MTVEMGDVGYFLIDPANLKWECKHCWKSRRLENGGQSLRGWAHAGIVVGKIG